jgi:hypothetical protein
VINLRKAAQRPVTGWVVKYLLYQLHRTLDATLSRWSCLFFQWLAFINLHWVYMVAYGAFSLRMEGICPSSVNINRLMMLYSILFLMTLVTEYHLS